jgi:hypothetical protein
MFPKHLQESAKWQQLNNQSSSFYWIPQPIPYSANCDSKKE